MRRRGGAGGRSSESNLLRLYLQDHLAGARAGRNLARRCRASNAGTPLGGVLEAIAREITEDAETLQRYARACGHRRSVVKELGAFLGERLGRLKANGRLRGYSPLSRVVELEGLLAGIDAKRSLWRSLELSGPRPAGAPDFSRLIERATDQRRRLEGGHGDAAVTAFGTATVVRATHPAPS